MGTILVVEDHDDIRDALIELLRSHGFDALASANAEEALDLLSRNEPPCIVLLDLMLPGMSGWEFRERLLRDARLASVPVVVVTATGGNVPPQVVATVRKPVDAMRLIGMVREHC